MKQKVRTLLSGQIPVAVIFLILGVCLITVPAASFNVISKVAFGLALICSGLYHVFIYCFPRKGTVSSGLDLYPGVISLVLGIFLFTNPQLVRVLLPWVLGAFVIADCAWMVKGALQMRSLNVAMWETLIVVAVVFAVLGGILIANPFSQVRTMLTFAGWVLVIKAIIDVVLYIQSKKKVDLAMAQQRARSARKPESYAMAAVEPQRPSAPSWKQKWDQKNAEKKAQRAAAKEEARAREEAERLERIRRAQEQSQEEEVYAGTGDMRAAEEAMDADFMQTEAAEGDDPGAEHVFDADFTESDVAEEGGEE